MGFLGLKAAIVFHPPSRGTYAVGPSAFAAERCIRCKRCVVSADTSCQHQMKEGWVFPQAALLWVAGNAPWAPAFWFPFNRRGVDGRRAEAIVSNRLPLTVASTRRRSNRCSKCGALEILYEKTAA
jgi:hypothetical protein